MNSRGVNLFGDASSSEEDEPATAILDVWSDSDSEEELVMWSDPPPPPVLAVEPEANNNAAPPAPLAKFRVASCLCKGTQGRTCRDSCACFQAHIECGAGCGCGGLCFNSRVDENKLYVAKSLIPGAGDGQSAVQRVLLPPPPAAPPLGGRRYGE